MVCIHSLLRHENVLPRQSGCAPLMVMSGMKSGRLKSAQHGGLRRWLAMDIGNREDSLLWGVTWCVPCAHSQSESLCLGRLTVSSGLSRLTAR